MGADIHSFAEVKVNEKWIMVTEPVFNRYGEATTSEPFSWRSYAMFGFLADVRNYSRCDSICDTKGLPKDSEWLNNTCEMDGNLIPVNMRETNRQNIIDSYYHSFSWLTLKELLEFDYEQTF